MRYARLHPVAAILAALFACLAAADRARGDVFELTSGGRIEGRLVEDAGGEENYVIETADGSVTIARAHVVKIDSTSAAEREYEELARTSPDTVEAHWELSEWCREQRLRKRSHEHLARILTLDPHHEQARAILGFKKQHGEWMTRDEIMASRGLVLYEGRYVTPHHVELMERAEETKLSEADWSDRLERARRALVGRREDRAAQALEEIRQLRDPLAAEPLVRLLEREENYELRRLWIAAAARIDHPACTRALIDLSLFAPEEEIRMQSLEYLIDSGRRGIIAPYIVALRSKDNEIVNRAGGALGQLADEGAIAPLIGALITEHRFQVSGGSPGQQGYTFSDSGTFSFGGGGPQFVRREVRNPAVLGALVNLAGTSFDYDEQAWRAWLASRATRREVDLRRDE